MSKVAISLAMVGAFLAGTFMAVNVDVGHFRAHGHWRERQGPIGVWEYKWLAGKPPICEAVVLSKSGEWLSHTEVPCP